MGDVYLALDTLLGQHVALKLLKDTLATAENLRKRFEREVTLCAALVSNHIVQVRDCGVTSEGYPFYVMEYLRGESLGELLRREQKVSVERTVEIIRQVCLGLQLAHKGVTLWRDGATLSEHIQVVHRDLKPDNIFLIPTDLGELVKVLDFGIAKIRDEAAEFTNLTSTFLGTFRYAAPEQLQVEHNIDGRADIYSLGIILYEMLSGSDPFGFGVKARSTSGVSWGIAHTSKPPQSLRSHPGCDLLPAELEAVVMRCLNKSPDDRFQSVEELSFALQATLSQLAGTTNTQVDRTIAQMSSSAVQGSLDQTVERPIHPSNTHENQETPTTPPATAEGAIDQTIDRPLHPPLPDTPNHDGTEVQIPPVPRSLDPTVDRPATPLNTTAQIPVETAQLQKDLTDVQIPATPERQTIDSTSYQTPTPRSARHTTDATIAQPPADREPAKHRPTPRAENFDTTIVQGVNPPTTKQSNNNLLLYSALAGGISVVVLAIAAFFIFSPKPTPAVTNSTPSSPSSPSSPTDPSTLDPCKENPNSVFCHQW
jgi:serine/threonine-protein kinase